MTRYTKELRAGLLVLGVPMLWIGVWGLITPQGFYDDFPGGGRNWVSALGPYNEHLVRDFAALNLGLGLLLAFAAFTLDRRLVQGALIAVVAYSAPHLGFHLTEFDEFGTSDNLLSTSALVLNVALPLVLLALTRAGVQSKTRTIGPTKEGVSGWHA